MGDVTPPPLQGPTSKEKKYDRQLRLWGSNGQAALEEAHMLLVNSGCGVVGVETLKNLVLPGIGKFTILDCEKITDADLGVNFFLDESSLGDSRAKHCCHLLQELNPDVQGDYTSEPTESCLERADFLKPYTLIVLTAPIRPSILSRISTYSNEHRIPVFYVHSVGFYSRFSIFLPATFPIVETHPESTSAVDLRLLDPWPELASLAKEKTQNLEALSNHDHGHVPYLLLLLHYLEIWKDAHGGKPPQNYDEKCSFRESVRKGARSDEQAGIEENYDEAVGAVLKSVKPSTIRSGVREVLEADECTKLNNQSANFWVVASAIASFYQKHALLPLPGSLPDMKAQSADYIRLQNVYKSKARKDFAEVLKIVRGTEELLGRQNLIDEREVETFCKEANFVKLVKGRPLHATRSSPKELWNDIARLVDQERHNPESLLPIHIAFLVYDGFTANFSENPTSSPHHWSGSENQTKSLLDYALPFLQQLSQDTKEDSEEDIENKEAKGLRTQTKEVIQEMIRADSSELHNISSLTGGMVAQEIIKVITKQYIPMDNTCVFDGVNSRSSVLTL